MTICQQEEREAGRAYPRTCPTCRFGPCQKYGRTPLATLDALRAENERLRAALQPFADADKYYDQSFDDDYSPRWAKFFTIGDFRRARAALAQKGGE